MDLDAIGCRDGQEREVAKLRLEDDGSREAGGGVAQDRGGMGALVSGSRHGYLRKRLKEDRWWAERMIMFFFVLVF